jgi:hypothetical protein
MADEKVASVEETKWWIDRGPVKEREKKEQLGRGVIEQWVYQMLKDYRQEQAVRNVVDINPRLLKELSAASPGWEYRSLEVGTFPQERLAAVKNAIRLPPEARALAIDAGYSLRVLVTGEPVGERVMDINFTEAPSLDYWIGGELVEERIFHNFDDALRRLRSLINRFLNPPPL